MNDTVPNNIEGQDPSERANAELGDMSEAIRLLTEKLRQSEEARVAAQKRADDAEQRAAESPGTATMSQASSKERWAIVIDEAHSETENQEVFVQVNGRAYQIQRGVTVHVPPEVVGVLKDAVVGVSRQEHDDFGRPKGITVRNAPRFPFRVIGKVIDKDGNPVK